MLRSSILGHEFINYRKNTDKHTRTKFSSKVSIVTHVVNVGHRGVSMRNNPNVKDIILFAPRYLSNFP